MNPMLSQARSSTYASLDRRFGTEPAMAAMNIHALIDIKGTQDVEEARLIGFDLARQAAFDESVGERAALIATEAGNNILRHSGEGQILARLVGANEPAVEIIAVDRGPGIAHLSAAMRGGYSTSRGSGLGLRAMLRAANLFDIYSRPGQGTALIAQVWARSLRYYATTRDYANPCLKSSAISVAETVTTPGEPSGVRVIGDAWVTKHQPSRSLIMVVSGLGKGEESAKIATEAVRVMEEVHRLEPAEIIEVMHEALDGTRGASVAVAEIRLSSATPEIRFAGVGNISARVTHSDGAFNLDSRHGIVGYEAEIQEFLFPWIAQSTLVIHTVGLSAGWNTEDYPGLLASHPSLIAAVLHRDYSCGTEGATVVVVK